MIIDQSRRRQDTSLNIALSTLDSCSLTIDKIIIKIDNAILYYKKSEVEYGNHLFNEIVETTDLLIQLIGDIYGSLRSSLGTNYNKAPMLQQLEIHLLSIMKAMIPAHEKNDLIMLCDLLEFELVDNLNQWKIKGIPHIKKLSDI